MERVFEPSALVEAGLSDYYLVEEFQAKSRGMAIALPYSTVVVHRSNEPRS